MKSFGIVFFTFLTTPLLVFIYFFLSSDLQLSLQMGIISSLAAGVAFAYNLNPVHQVLSFSQKHEFLRDLVFELAASGYDIKNRTDNHFVFSSYKETTLWPSLVEVYLGEESAEVSGPSDIINRISNHLAKASNSLAA